jgi:hypothetical protein
MQARVVSARRGRGGWRGARTSPDNVARRYGTKQVDGQPSAVIAELQAAFNDAATLGYAAAGVPLRL